MSFIAEKCRLGHALLETLEELLPGDRRTREAVLRLYRRIFEEHFDRVRDQLSSCNLTALCYDHREFPLPCGLQYFQCLASELQLKPDPVRFDSTRHFVMVEGVEAYKTEKKKKERLAKSRRR